VGHPGLLPPQPGRGPRSRGSRLGRRVEELQPEIDELCKDKILQCAGGLIRYRPTPELRETISKFVEACQERGRRLALIALVLHKINPHS
jgi:hypothetical protein